MIRHQFTAPRLAPCALLALAACGGGGGGSDNSQLSAAKTAAAIDQLDQQTSAGLQAAKHDLEQAIALDDGNALAHLLLGGVRIVALIDDNQMPTDGSPPCQLAALMDGFGIDLQGASVFDLMQDLQDGTLPDQQSLLPLPDDSPQMGDVQAFLAGDLLDCVRQGAEDWEHVPQSFSQTVTLFGATFEVDYADARLLAAAARLAEAGLQLQAAFVLEADLDELANWQQHGLAMPYRLYTGDSPGNIVIGQTTPDGRRGFLNEPVVLDTVNTFLPAPGADAAFDGVRHALAAAIHDLQAALTYVEDPNPDDDLLALPPEILCPVGLAGPWIEDLVVAIEGGDSLVAPLSASNADCAIKLPGFTFDSNLIFSSATWSGRLLFPDYPDGTTYADETSWAHLLADPAFQQIFADFGGTAPSGAYLLEVWNGLNGLWDTVFAGEPLETAY
jgi:hypothetical protein